jgi:hypothetical protein
MIKRAFFSKPCTLHNAADPASLARIRARVLAGLEHRALARDLLLRLLELHALLHARVPRRLWPARREALVRQDRARRAARAVHRVLRVDSARKSVWRAGRE